MERPIEDYALIGDGESAALVSRDASIDWLCWPRFDSDACFAALLGGPEHGRWRIGPTADGWQVSRRYRGETLVLETDFTQGPNAARVVDFMPLRDHHPALVRIVTGLSGQVDLRSEMALRFDYGQLPPWQEMRAEGLLGIVGPDLVLLSAPVPVRLQDEIALAEVSISAGQSLAFVLSYGPSNQALPPALDADVALAATETWWRDWAGQFHRRAERADAVMRSLITLKALVYRPTGALLAAPTTSLPEAFGGSLNWDYRYCWLRDATFTISALLNGGYHDEAIAWRDWMLRAVAGSPEKMRIMYRVDGGRHINEWNADWLPGYAGSRPVRVGNAAAAQEQLDVPGELIDALHLMRRAGLPLHARGLAVERALVERLEQTWDDSGHGMWESRGDGKHYVYPKAMVWAGLDRFLRGHATSEGADPALIARLSALRATLHAEICDKGYDSERGHFVQSYGDTALDASLLLLAPIGFLPANDPRIRGTVAAIERELMSDGFVLRMPPSRSREGAFLACTCWLADCYSMMGQKDRARTLLNRVLAVGNDLGLLAEEYDTGAKRLCGNFPQALTHLAVVNTALGLAGPVLQRAGG